MGEMEKRMFFGLFFWCIIFKHLFLILWIFCKYTKYGFTDEET